MIAVPMKRLLLLGVMALAIASPLHATRVRRLSRAEIAAQASAVIVVDVLASSARVGDANMVWTDYRVRVAEVVRGRQHAGEVLTLPFAGGRAGGLDVGFDGVPRLEIGRRYLLFLDDAPGRPVPAIGWTQGLFRRETKEGRSRWISLDGDGHSGSCTCGGFASFPIRWEIEHQNHPDFAAAAAAEFARWNRYVDVFDARTGDGVAGPNGTNEIGFFDHATASAKYGISLDRNTFAITYMTPLSAAGDFDGCPMPPETVCGTFTETDVIMNSEFVRGFTPFGPLDYADRGPALYGATAAHELGHALGFHHNVNNISVMNLYEDFAAQYIAASDTVEARAAYASRAVPVTDLAAYPFHFDPELSDYAATTHVDVSPARVAPGGTITVRNFGFENVGTGSVSGVELRIYLSRDAHVTAADALIGRIPLDESFAPGAFWEDGGAGRTFALPLDLEQGTYSVGALITHGGGATDSATDNNAWIAPQQVTVGSAVRRRAARH